MAESVDPLVQARSESDALSEDNDYLKLRQLLLGQDYDSALQRYISKEEDAERVAKVLALAVDLSRQKDDSLGDALAPVVDQAIGNSIEANPKRITNVIFPIMGPAIRKAVASALTEMVQSLNTLLEQSLTLNSVKWRISAWRSGVPYAQYVLLQTIQYRVEQVFLVHRETGLLLHSLTAKEVSAQDPELVSSMLTAITDFVSDSFAGNDVQGNESETLERIRFGQLELLLYSGPEATLALAVRGSASDELNSKAHQVIEVIHQRYASLLSRFDGDRSAFEEAEPLLAECLISQKLAPAPKKKPWLAIIVILFSLGFLANLQYKQYQFESLLSEIESGFQQEPDYVLIRFEPVEYGAKVEIMRSPQSRKPQELLEGVNLQLGENRVVDIEIAETLVHFGPLPEPPKLPEPRPLSESEKYRLVVSKVEGHTFYFEPKETSLTEQELEKIPLLIQDIKSLEEIVRQSGHRSMQLSVIGFADNQGTDYGNKTVSQKRADTIKEILLLNGVSSDLLVAWGVGHIDHASLGENHQRRVNLLVTPKSFGDDQYDKGAAE